MESNRFINTKDKGYNKTTKEGERALSSLPTKSTRANSTNHPNYSTILKEDEWCHYGGLPSPKAYMD